MKYIVTHSGQAHADDFLACCFALSTCDWFPPVYRREPTEEELEDPEVLVLDVGGRHEPEKGNFDHHQLPRDAEPECALSLYSRYLGGKNGPLGLTGLNSKLEYQGWYETLKVLDSKGPFALAKAKGWEKFPFELLSPVAKGVLEIFQAEEEVPDYLRKLMSAIGKNTIDATIKFASGVDRCSRLPRKEVKGIEVLVNESTDATGLQEGRDRLVAEGHDIAACVSHDDRGNGWALYRFSDHERVDFSVLKDDERVLFAHANGFIAKTKELLSLDEVIELVAKAIK
ncbi:MAG: MYG1 family protein [DPANN group archaeon]|nr:MYG1 family protein [DPANN group archaeon]